MLHLTGRHIYMATPPQLACGTPARRGMTSSPPSTTTGFFPTTRGRRSGRRRSAGTTGAASAPACWSSETPSARGRTTRGSGVSAPGHRPPSSHTPATSVENATLCPPQRQRGPTGAHSAPRWPPAPGQNPPRARTGARKRRPCTGASGGAHTPSHERAGPTGAALLWIHVHLRDPTSVAHLSHLFAPCPPTAAALYRAGSTMPRRRGDGPGHARACRRAQEAVVRGLVADAVTEAHEAHAAAQSDPMGSARGFHQRCRPPGGPRPERSRGPYAAPSDAPDRESC